MKVVCLSQCSKKYLQGIEFEKTSCMDKEKQRSMAQAESAL
jgi:hypothetical protein